MVDVQPQDVLRFWLEAGSDKWYSKDEAFDAAIRERFGEAHAAASTGRLDGWVETPEGALALVIVLDQFSRNLHRGSPETFANDEAALRHAESALAAGYDRAVTPELREFFAMPFMHSERLADQERSVALCHALHAGEATLPYALEHERIIRRFARFPHRNTILGRHTTPAERAFLDEGGFSG